MHRRGLDRAGQAVVPAVVLGQAWRGGPQPQLSRLLKGCVIESFDENVGRLLRDTGTSDVVDAHVVLTTLRYRAAVFTSAPDDLQRLAATSKIRLRLHQVDRHPVVMAPSPTILLMSPVSRGRKRKKSKTTSDLRAAAHRRTPGKQTNHPQPVFTAPQRPAWFDSATKTVLDQADVVMAARGPRELEQVTAELLGAELHRVLNEEHHGMWFNWWFEELTEAATAQIREEGRNGAWEPPWRLLHGMTAIGQPTLQSRARRAVDHATKELRDDAAVGQQPSWLRQLARITATGEVWEMRDVYGTRIALIAGFSYPDGVDHSVFLFDIDACGIIEIVHAGVFDDVPQAATAWQTWVGDTAGSARPERVETAEHLHCLVHCHIGERFLQGTESRTVLDNWFRARRRIHDLADALRKRGMPLPVARSLYHDIDTDPMATAFTDWYVRRHGTEPDPEAVDALAQEWMEGALPDTWHAISPHRVEFQFTLINDWIPDNPVTIAAKALLPEWVRWHGEQAGLPGHLIDRGVAVATGGTRATPDCAGHQRPN